MLRRIFNERNSLECQPMSSILDIDLDYFNLVKNPICHLEELLRWAACPVSFIVDRHNHAFARWKRRTESGSLPIPSHILHVDEHHDMMNERKQSNIANVMYHAMRTWPECRVHWLVQDPIDSPDVWISEETWHSFRQRFTVGPLRPKSWPRPDLVSVCSSPDFVEEQLRADLLNVAQRFTIHR
jgi:hypothetical protein